MAYATLTYYKDAYLQGGAQVVPDELFTRAAREASLLIDERTFNRLASFEEIPNKVSDCACDLAEQIYTQVTATDGGTLKSESVGDWSGTYNVVNKDASTYQAELNNTIERYCRYVRDAQGVSLTSLRVL